MSEAMCGLHAKRPAGVHSEFGCRALGLERLWQLLSAGVSRLSTKRIQVWSIETLGIYVFGNNRRPMGWIVPTSWIARPILSQFYCQALKFSVRAAEGFFIR